MLACLLASNERVGMCGTNMDLMAFEASAPLTRTRKLLSISHQHGQQFRLRSHPLIFPVSPASFYSVTSETHPQRRRCLAPARAFSIS